MRLHGNARTCLHSRLLIVERVLERRWTIAAAAGAAGVSERTAAKWLARYRAEGRDGLLDRSSAPRRMPRRTVRRAGAGDRAAAAAADDSGRDRRDLADAALDRLGDLAADRARQALAARAVRAAEPVRMRAAGRARPYRRQEARPLRPVRAIASSAAALVASRTGAGYEYLHVCVDDYSRLAYAELLADERAATAVGFLHRALGFFAARGVACRAGADRQRLRLPLAPLHARLSQRSGIRHTPHKATPTPHQRQSRALHPDAAHRLGLRAPLLRQRRTSRGPPDLAQALQLRRPHGSLGQQPPGSRLNNVSGNYT